MTRTREGAGTSHEGDDDLPPPPYAMLVEIMAQLLETQRFMGEVLHGLA